MKRPMQWLSLLLEVFAVWIPLVMCVLCLVVGFVWGNASLRLAGVISLLIILAGWFFTRRAADRVSEDGCANLGTREVQDGMTDTAKKVSPP